MKIGITGIIGSGKTSVVAILREHGYETFDCDEYVHYLYTTKSVKNEICKYFDVLNEHGEIDRSLLSKIVFHDNVKLSILNNIIHPLVIEKIKSLSNNIVVDIPIVFEINIQYLFDTVVLVVSDESILIDRIVNRNGLSSDEALNIINLRMNVKEMIELTDYIIYNNGTYGELESEVERLIRWLHDTK